MTPTVEEGPFVTVADPAPAPGLWTLLQVIHTNSTGGQENLELDIWLEQAQLGMRRVVVHLTSMQSAPDYMVTSIFKCPH